MIGVGVAVGGAGVDVGGMVGVGGVGVAVSVGGMTNVGTAVVFYGGQ